MVEPVGGFLGAYAVTLFEPMLPWAMAFAAGNVASNTTRGPSLWLTLSFRLGAMIFVVYGIGARYRVWATLLTRAPGRFDDIVPECSAEGNTRLASWFGIGGFVLMTVMDVMF